MTYQVFVAKMSMIPVRSVIDIATTIIFCILSSCFASFRKKHRQISAKKKPENKMKRLLEEKESNQSFSPHLLSRNGRGVGY